MGKLRLATATNEGEVETLLSRLSVAARSSRPLGFSHSRQAPALFQGLQEGGRPRALLSPGLSPESGRDRIKQAFAEQQV